MTKEIFNKFLVMKWEWINENLNSTELTILTLLLKKACSEKPNHSYYVVNTDEPYAKKIKELILNGEQEKHCTDCLNFGKQECYICNDFNKELKQ